MTAAIVAAAVVIAVALTARVRSAHRSHVAPQRQPVDAAELAIRDALYGPRARRNVEVRARGRLEGD